MTEGTKKLIYILATAKGCNWYGKKGISMAQSRSDAQRLIKEGAVKFGQKAPWNTWNTIYEYPKENGIIRIGSKPNNLRFLKISRCK